MDSKKCGISVIIPAYNEEQSIESSILHTIETFQLLDIDFEIIVVDDSSVDSTGELAVAMTHRHPDMLVLRHEINQGSGGAFKTGIAHASMDYVIFIPVDSPPEFEDMQAYMPLIELCDIVVGFRIERVGYTRFARFASFTYNRIFVPLLFNIGVDDVNWIQIYRRKLFTDRIIDFDSTSLFWLVEILIRAKKKRLIIAEVPTRMKKRVFGKPTSARWSVIFQTFIDMIKFFWMIHIKGRSQ
jgi:glycosyltransferase involved in cell wall biosynthesis